MGEPGPVRVNEWQVLKLFLSSMSFAAHSQSFKSLAFVVANSTGVVCYDADFTPYGGERAYTNTCAPNYYKFEGKERDLETGNDDFGGRYYSNRFGRWLSGDWSAVPVAVPYAHLTNPQTLNLYSMVADDPESFADLDGHQYFHRESVNIDDPCRQNDPYCYTNLAIATENSGSSQQAQTQTQQQNAPEQVVTKKKRYDVPLGKNHREAQYEYSISSMDSNGKVTTPENNQQVLQLKESNVKGDLKSYCEGGESCKGRGSFVDTMGVSKGKEHSIDKRFEIDGKAARAYDATTQKAYDFIHVDASVNGFVFTYENDPQK